MHRTLFAALALMTSAACIPTSACDDYVDYMCDCHPEEDCAELRTIHQGAAGEELTDCTVALNDQQQDDVAEGEECATSDTGA